MRCLIEKQMKIWFWLKSVKNQSNEFWLKEVPLFFFAIFLTAHFTSHFLFDSQLRRGFPCASCLAAAAATFFDAAFDNEQRQFNDNEKKYAQFN